MTAPLPHIPVIHSSWKAPLVGEIKYKAFMVSQSHPLIMIADSKDATPQERIEAIEKCVNDCLVSDHKAEELPSFILEALWIKIRAISVSDMLNIRYRCKAKDEDGNECENPIPMTFDLTELTIKGELDDKVDIGSGFGVQIRWPSLGMVKELADMASNDPTAVLKVLLKNVYNEEDVWDFSEYTDEALTEWIGNLAIGVKAEIIGKLTALPYISLRAETECGKCGKSHSVELKSLHEAFM